MTSHISYTDRKLRQSWDLLPGEVQDSLTKLGFIVDRNMKFNGNDLSSMATHEPKNHRIEIRLTKSQLEKIAVKAKTNNMHVSSYMRYKALF